MIHPKLEFNREQLTEMGMLLIIGMQENLRLNASFVPDDCFYSDDTHLVLRNASLAQAPDTLEGKRYFFQSYSFP